MPLQRRHLHRARRVAEREEPSMAPALGLVGVDRERLVGPAAGMDHVIGAAAERPLQPGVEMSNTSGEWTGIVGCRHDGGCQAR